MQNMKTVWFYFAIIVCPILVLWGLFTLGKLIGQAVFSEGPMPPPEVQEITFVCGGICALFVFVRALKEAKSRLTTQTTNS